MEKIDFQHFTSIRGGGKGVEVERERPRQYGRTPVPGNVCSRRKSLTKSSCGDNDDDDLNRK
jgi:hypothetical protein